MKSCTICLSLALCVSVASGFTGGCSKAFVRLLTLDRNSAVRVSAHRKYGPDVDDDELLSLIHPDRCSSCLNSAFGVSPRAARIEIPMRVFFASSAFASRALADDAEAPVHTLVEDEAHASKSGEDASKSEQTAMESKSVVAQEPAPPLDSAKPNNTSMDAKPAEEEAKLTSTEESPETNTQKDAKLVEEEAKTSPQEESSNPESIKDAKPAEEEVKPALPEEPPKPINDTNAAEKEAKPDEEEAKPDEEEAKPTSEPPKPKTFQEAMQKYFPQALPTSVVAAKVQAALSQRKFTRANTLFGTSVCPDEVNNKPTKSLPAVLQNAVTDLNGVFHLGGLAGLPYMGTSGMRAFLSHTPSNGKVFILYGPHIGVTDDGQIGSVERLGKSRATIDCDTTLNALKVAQSLQTPVDATIGDEAQKAAAKKARIGAPDRREEFIVTKLRTALDSKEASTLTKDDLPAFATYTMFELIKEQIIKQLQACLKDDSIGNVAWSGNIDEIVLLGGIIVNRGQISGSIEPREDYFEPLVFETYSSPGNFGALAEGKDLFQPAFGAKPIPFYAL